MSRTYRSLCGGVVALGAAGGSLALSPESSAQNPPPARFERIVIDDAFPGGYQVEVADVNGDGKPDLVALGGKTLAWYQNPTWTRRVIAPAQLPGDIISSATRDLDGDGKAEIAVACDFAMNEPKRGKLVLAVQGAGPDDPWTLRPLADVPSIHRLRWLDFSWGGKPDLVVAPLFGPGSRPPAYDQDVARLLACRVPADPKSGPWSSRVLAELPVLHAIEVGPIAPAWWQATGMGGGGGLMPIGGPGQTGRKRVQVGVYAASNLGVFASWFDDSVTGKKFIQVTPGASGSAPKRGSSEVHTGHLASGAYFVATIDPWHGGEVAVSTTPVGGGVMSSRVVIDDTLDDGHALWVADVDGDGDDEIFAGHRGKDPRVSVYDFDGKRWNRTVLDSAIAAQDLRGGDLDGDGVPDVVAIGGKTHNLVWYRPIRPAK